MARNFENEWNRKANLIAVGQRSLNQLRFRKYWNRQENNSVITITKAALSGSVFTQNIVARFILWSLSTAMSVWYDAKLTDFVKINTCYQIRAGVNMCQSPVIKMRVAYNHIMFPTVRLKFSENKNLHIIAWIATTTINKYVHTIIDSLHPI